MREAARKAEIVIVTFHGGAEGGDKTHVPRGAEYFFGENRGDLRTFSKAVIDAGADLVIGHGRTSCAAWRSQGPPDRLQPGQLRRLRGLRLSPVTATSMVLKVTLEPDGRLRRGRIHPTQLVGAGTPAPGGNAISMVRDLSAAGLRRPGPAHRRGRRHHPSAVGLSG